MDRSRKRSAADDYSPSSKYRRTSEGVDDLTKSLKYLGVEENEDVSSGLSDLIESLGGVELEKGNIYYGVNVLGSCFNRQENSSNPYKFFVLIRKSTGLVEYLYNNPIWIKGTQCYLSQGGLQTIAAGTILVTSSFTNIPASAKRGNIYALHINTKSYSIDNFKKKFVMVTEQEKTKLRANPITSRVDPEKMMEISEYNTALEQTDFIDTLDKLENFRNKIDIVYESRGPDLFKAKFVFGKDDGMKRRRKRKNRRSKPRSKKGRKKSSRSKNGRIKSSRSKKGRKKSSRRKRS